MRFIKTRECKKCGFVKPLGALPKSNTCKDGRTHTCKTCTVTPKQLMSYFGYLSTLK